MRLQELPDFVRRQHVLQGVVERTQVRIHLLLEVARQESERLAGLHRGAGQDDPPDGLLVQRVDRHRDGEISLARSRGPDADHDVVPGHGPEILLLPTRLRLDDLLRAADEDLAGLHSAQRIRRPRLQLGPVAPDVADVEARAGLNELDEVLEQRRRSVDGLRIAGQAQLPAARHELRAAQLLDELQVLILGPEKRQLVDAGEGNGAANGRRVGGRHEGYRV